jgi:NADPH2:quinone reductase
MRAVVLRALGAAPEYGQFDEPESGEGGEVVDVLAAGLNPADLYMSSGRYGAPPLPSVVGFEGIARTSDGRRVYFGRSTPPYGSMAERTLVHLASTVPVPEGLDEGLALAIGIAGQAGWLALGFQARLQPGESVLVLGASGVAGQIAVQGAKLLGAGRVVAAARAPETLEQLRARGADEIVVLGAGDDSSALKEAAGDGYDVVVDSLFGPALEAAFPATAFGARIVSFGASAGFAINLSLPHLVGRRLIGHTNNAAPRDVQRATYERMASHAAAGEIVVDTERIPLERVAEAWERQGTGPHRKLVLVP